MSRVHLVSSSPAPSAPAGWFPDPQGEAALRYWDGNAWTAHTHGAPVSGSAAGPVKTPPPAKLGALGWIGIAAVVLVGIGVWAGAQSRSGGSDGSEDPIEQARVVLSASHDERYSYDEVKRVTDQALAVTGEPAIDRNRAGAWSAVLQLAESNDVSPMAIMRCVTREGAGAEGAGLGFPEVAAICATTVL